MKRYFSIIALVCAVSLVWAEEMPDNYYSRAEGTKDAELKDSLKAIIRNHTSMSYGSGVNSTWGVFYYSDRDEEGYCMDMYCDSWQKFTSPGTAVSGCNIEHSFAKSWWGGKTNDAYEDCYHLNPSNSTANSSRSNYPLGVPVKEFKENTGSLRVGKIHHDSLNTDFWVFEPKDEYKGDFARAYFYMATCYGHWSDGTYDPICTQYQGWRLDNKDVGSRFAMQNDNYLEFQPWEQEVLIAWHRQDPVSIKEIRRQDAVSNFQHNRNPFIDYPYLAEYIWGERAGEEVNMSQLMSSSDDAFLPGVSNGWRGDSLPVVVKPKYSVTWMANGEEIRVDSVTVNKRVQTMPNTPISCSKESAEFMGWTNMSISGVSDDKPAKLYTKVSEIPSVSQDITLYAVFARKTTYDGGEPATYIFDDDHQDGWTTNANYTSYWILDAGKTLVSPEVNLAGLESIAVKIRTYGGKDNNTLTIKAGDEIVATIVTTTGSTMTEYTWTNSGSLSGKSSLTFSTNYGSGKGIGIERAIINATGARVVFDRYITSCQTESEVRLEAVSSPARKILVGGQIYLQIGDNLYNLTGQRVK